jgi:hypothetical protein
MSRPVFVQQSFYLITTLGTKVRTHKDHEL